MFRRYLGVDFSASRLGGRHTWLAVAEPDRGRLAVRDLRPAADLPGGRVERPAHIVALRTFLADQADALIGLDFPFSLPAELMEAANWMAFLRAFRRRFPDPEALRTRCRARTGGRELRRQCDVEAATPFSAYNLRLYRQTWWGIAEVVARLVIDGRARAAPMQVLRPGTPTLTETCPASVLKRLGCYRPGYKGQGASQAARRRAILQRLSGEGVAVPPPLAACAAADPHGDALDALLAALAAWRAGRDPATLTPRSREDRLEARVYC